jgi:hypothetical protein
LMVEPSWLTAVFSRIQTEVGLGFKIPLESSVSQSQTVCSLVMNMGFIQTRPQDL